MAKLLDFITVPAARASILWLIGEYNEKVPKIAPDVLRKMAKTFVDEVTQLTFIRFNLHFENVIFQFQQDTVKLQVLNLAVKLYLTNPEQTKLLCQYVFSLARYDQNYDIRDRSRFLRQFICPSNGTTTILSENARRVFLAAKPAPTLESKYHGREQFQLGSLSHYLNMRANGYHDIPDFPDVAPDSTVRNVESSPGSSGGPSIKEHIPVTTTKSAKSSSAKDKNRSFYSESENSSSEYLSSSEDEESDDVAGSNEAATSDRPLKKSNKIVATDYDKKSSESGQDEDEDDDDNDDDDDNGGSVDGETDSSSDEDESSSEESSDEASSSSDQEPENKNFQKAKQLATQIPVTNANGKTKPAPKSNLDLLLDLDDISPAGPIMTPSLGGFLTPMQSTSPFVVNKAAAAAVAANYQHDLVGPSFIPFVNNELMNKVNGYGLGVTYRFTRSPHLVSAAMVSIELQFTNHSSADLENIQIGQKTLPAGMSLTEFATVAKLAPQALAIGTLGIDFNDSTQPVTFEICSSAGTTKVTLKSTVGEFIRSITMSDERFTGERSKLRGMNEHMATVSLAATLTDLRRLQQRVFETANFASIVSGNAKALYFTGQTLSSRSLVLVVIEIVGDAETDARITVSCEKMVIGSMLLNEIKLALLKN